MFKNNDKRGASPFLYGMGGAGANKATKADAGEQAQAKAKLFAEESTGRTRIGLRKIEALSEGYWFYGYFMGCMSVTMLGTLAVGSRVPFLSKYAGWVSLLGGYGGGSLAMQIHRMVLTRDFCKLLDRELATAHQLDDDTGNIYGEYAQQIRMLETTKNSLMGVTEGHGLSTHESAEDLAARYAKKMNWDASTFSQKLKQ